MMDPINRGKDDARGWSHAFAQGVDLLGALSAMVRAFFD